MRVFAEYSEPEHVKDRQAYRLRIEGKNGQAIEVVEQMEGGFLVASVALGSKLVIRPISGNAIIVESKP